MLLEKGVHRSQSPRGNDEVVEAIRKIYGKEHRRRLLARRIRNGIWYFLLAVLVGMSVAYVLGVRK